VDLPWGIVVHARDDSVCLLAKKIYKTHIDCDAIIYPKTLCPC